MKKKELAAIKIIKQEMKKCKRPRSDCFQSEFHCDFYWELRRILRAIRKEQQK